VTVTYLFIISNNVFYTPGLVINEKLVSAGRFPEVLEIQGWLQEALTAPA
jgi:hypothetical protein